MTKKQKAAYCNAHGVKVVGSDNSSVGYRIESVAGESFTIRQQNAAHLALNRAFLEIFKKESGIED